MKRPPGRPPRDAASLSRSDMLSAALALLDHGGAEAFTMRALAARLQVNPMTLYHHFGNRDGLIAALSERVYGGVAAPETGSPRSRIEALLQGYHRQVLCHPGLTLLIFSHPAVFPEQAQRITESIAALLTEAGLSPQKAGLWVNILVDFTHGAAVATAMGGRSGESMDDGYATGLAALLDAIAR